MVKMIDSTLVTQNGRMEGFRKGPESELENEFGLDKNVCINVFMNI